MGLLTSFFHDLKRDRKGKLERILVVDEGTAATAAAAEALVRMLGWYLVEAEEGNPAKVLPYVNILDLSRGSESRCKQIKASWMEYTVFKEGEEISARERIGLTFDKGRIFKSLRSGTERRGWEMMATGCFPVDSRGEARSILLNMMLTMYALENNYDIILYCDTATKIASKVLALTSQGRGFSLPWECGSLLKRNGIPPTHCLVIIIDSDIYVARPLKELSDTEIAAYLNILNDRPLTTENTSTPNNTDTTTEIKPATTIDEMMRHYISGLETSFPSIVATTGHTAEKLDFPEIQDGDGGKCVVCLMPRQKDNVKKWLDDITVTQAAPLEEERTAQEETVEGVGEEGEDVTGEVCYGCYTLFRGSRGIVEWPI